MRWLSAIAFVVATLVTVVVRAADAPAHDCCTDCTNKLFGPTAGPLVLALLGAVAVAAKKWWDSLNLKRTVAEVQARMTAELEQLRAEMATEVKRVKQDRARVHEQKQQLEVELASWRPPPSMTLRVPNIQLVASSSPPAQAELETAPTTPVTSRGDS